MKKTRFTEAQIMGALRQMEGGVPAAELCREHGMSSATLYKWRAKHGGMDASLISEMKAMAEENRRLKRMYADVSMQNDLLKEALGQNDPASSTPRAGRESGGDEGRQHRIRPLSLDRWRTWSHRVGRSMSARHAIDIARSSMTRTNRLPICCSG